ncbi:hypothetical protein [Acetivibrio cellulolyticus]
MGSLLELFQYIKPLASGCFQVLERKADIIAVVHNDRYFDHADNLIKMESGLII